MFAGRSTVGPVALLLGMLGPGLALAQTTRIATTADVLVSAAGFFHGRAVVLLQQAVTENDITRLANAPKPIYVLWRDRPGGDRGEIRGEFWDLGRMEPGDSRFAGHDLGRLIDTVNRGQWPGRDQIFVLLGASLTPTEPPRAPSLRAIALDPDAYVDREVKVIGRFRGRNLYGELPLALGKSKWDFVLQSADGSLWVTGVRPRGKGFDLDPSRRADTAHWLEVTGVVKREGLMPYIEARVVSQAPPPAPAAVEVEGPPRPDMPPPEVIFSAPIANDTEVETTAPVRIQFSRDMDPKSIRDRVRVAYVGGVGSSLPPPAFTVVYNDAARAIEIKFQAPLAAFQSVKVELLEGLAAIDGQPLKPWTLTFSTGR